MPDQPASQATTPLHRRIALVFDFDSTLAPSSIDASVRRLGHDPERFRRERVDPLLDEEKFELVLAGFYAMIQDSRSRDDVAVTREWLAEVGRELEPFPGVPEMFDRVRGWARELVPGVEVEFYVLTSGHEEIHKATRIAHEFEKIWGSEFHFDENGEIDFPRRLITFHEKQQYVLALSKGTSIQGLNSPKDAYRPVPEGELHVPLDQMIYVGDGGSDLPVFSLLHDNGGIGIAVYTGDRADDWDALSKMRPGRRVEALVAADYREGSPLMESLCHAVRSIAARIALRAVDEK